MNEAALHQHSINRDFDLAAARCDVLASRHAAGRPAAAGRRGCRKARCFHVVVRLFGRGSSLWTVDVVHV